MNSYVLLGYFGWLPHGSGTQTDQLGMPMNGVDLIHSPAVHPVEVYPRGWYALAFSDELHPRDVKTIRFLGREYVLWRTASGEACAMEAYCPHLGAHLGHGGEVEGEAIRCPMHHFRFGTDGACVSSGYGCQSAPRSVARTLIVVEHAGFVLVHHEAETPLPALDDAPAGSVTEQQATVSACIDELAANALELHRLTGSEPAPIESGSHVLRLHHELHCDRGVFRELPGNRVELSVELYGLGVVVMEVATAPGDVRSRMVFTLTPVSAREIDVRVRTWSRDAHEEGVTWLFPRQVQRWLVRQMLQTGTLPEGERLEQFRGWASQFATHRAAGHFEVLPQNSCA